MCYKLKVCQWHEKVDFEFEFIEMCGDSVILCQRTQVFYKKRFQMCVCEQQIIAFQFVDIEQKPINLKSNASKYLCYTQCLCVCGYKRPDLRTSYIDCSIKQSP